MPFSVTPHVPDLAHPICTLSRHRLKTFAIFYSRRFFLPLFLVPFLQLYPHSTFHIKTSMPPAPAIVAMATHISLVLALLVAKNVNTSCIVESSIHTAIRTRTKPTIFGMPHPHYPFKADGRPAGAGRISDSRASAAFFTASTSFLSVLKSQGQ